MHNLVTEDIWDKTQSNTQVKDTSESTQAWKSRACSFPYPGGKVRLAKEIVSYFPKEGRLYLEPFAGRGNIFWRAIHDGLNFDSWQLNDIRTLPFFEALQGNGHLVSVTERTREEYYRLWEALKLDSKNAEALLMEPFLTFSGGGYGSGGFGNLKGASKESYAQTLKEAHRILNSEEVALTSVSWDQLNLADLHASDFVYLDPPYFAADVRAYKESDVRHRDLAKLLSTAKFKWVLSEYDTDFYQEFLGTPFWRKDVQLSVSNIATTTGRRSECLWRNF